MSLSNGKNKFSFLFCFLLLGILTCDQNLPTEIGATPGLNQRPNNNSCFAFSSTALEQITIEDAFPNLEFITPVVLAQEPGPGGDWFLGEQNGKIYKFPNDGATTQKDLVLDLGNKIINFVESGLVGFALHPDWPVDTRAFVTYGSPIAGNTYDFTNPQYPNIPVNAVLSSVNYKTDVQLFDPNSEKPILTHQKSAVWHFGGTVLFDENDHLFLTVGDGNNSANAQNLNNFEGSILRVLIDTNNDYQIPIDNPLVGTGNKEEIFAWGLRNPWKLSIDPVNGQLWAADVAGSGLEEINIITSGSNYGWPIYEGFWCLTGPCDTQDLVYPIAGFTHEDGCAAIGGYVYHGKEVPELEGVYIFGDYCTGSIYGLFPEVGGQYRLSLLLNAGFAISSFGVDSNGEIYILSYERGKIYKITGFSRTEAEKVARKLSETGCFSSQDSKMPREGLIPYDVNVPLWSDGAQKQRWFALPNDSQMEILDNGKWVFPTGTVFAKSFSLNGKSIETRLLMQFEDGKWEGLSYEWNDEQNEAFLVVEAGKTKTIEGQEWVFPSRSQCFRCHTDVAGKVLGAETINMNRLFTYPNGVQANQIETFNKIGLFKNMSPDDQVSFPFFPLFDEISANSSDLENVARAYLHVNCSFCHQPGGPGFGPEDFRYTTPLRDMGACNQAPFVSDLGIPDAKLLVPGDPDTSILLQRMKATNEHRMPPLATHLVDETGVSFIGEWIQSLETCN